MLSREVDVNRREGGVLGRRVVQMAVENVESGATKGHIVDFEADVEATLEPPKGTVPFGKGLVSTLMCTMLQACSIFVFLSLHCRFVCGVFRSSPCLRITTKYTSEASPGHRYIHHKYTLKEARGAQQIKWL